MRQFFLALILLTTVAVLNVQCRPASRGSAIALPSPALQTERTNSFVERSHANARGDKMPYLLFLPPGYNKREQYPLVLWLHGGGSRGDDLKVLLAYGEQHGPGFLARADNQAKFPSLIIAPQCPANRFWDNPESAQPNTEMKLVLEILDRVQAEYSVDKNRLYVMGMSLGGYGTWGMIARRPGMFAAAVPICGGGNTANAAAMKQTAIWAFHGDEDEMVSVKESQRMIAAIKNAGGNPRYTEYKGVGHNSWVRAFAEPELLSWMFRQKR